MKPVENHTSKAQFKRKTSRVKHGMSSYIKFSNPVPEMGRKLGAVH